MLVFHLAEVFDLGMNAHKHNIKPWNQIYNQIPSE